MDTLHGLHKGHTVPEMPTLEGPNAGGLPSLEGPNAGGKVKMLEVYIIGGGTRGAGGATAPPDFKIYVFGPPRFQHQN